MYQEWVDEIENDHEDLITVIENSRKTYGDDMGAFLCFIAVRLMAMRRLLKPTGGIYLHCDPTASHYLKMLMNAVFGRKNFRNEIIWKRNPSDEDSSVFGCGSENLLFNGADINKDAVRVPLDEETREQTSPVSTRKSQV